MTYHPSPITPPGPNALVKDRLRGFQFVAVDGVTHSRIETNVNHRSEPVQRRGRLLDPFLRDMRIDVTAPDEHRCAIEGAGEVERGPRWTDQPAAEPDDPGVSLRIARRRLQGQTGSLGETQQRDTLGRNAVLPNCAIRSATIRNAEERYGSFRSVGSRKR